MLWVQHLPKELAHIKLYIKHLKWGQTKHLGSSASSTKNPEKLSAFRVPLTLGESQLLRAGLGWTGVSGRLLGHHTAEGRGTGGGWQGRGSLSCLFPKVGLFVIAETTGRKVPFWLGMDCKIKQGEMST